MCLGFFCCEKKQQEVAISYHLFISFPSRDSPKLFTEEKRKHHTHKTKQLYSQETGELALILPSSKTHKTNSIIPSPHTRGFSF